MKLRNSVKLGHGESTSNHLRTFGRELSHFFKNGFALLPLNLCSRGGGIFCISHMNTYNKSAKPRNACLTGMDAPPHRERGCSLPCETPLQSCPARQKWSKPGRGSGGLSGKTFSVHPCYLDQGQWYIRLLMLRCSRIEYTYWILYSKILFSNQYHSMYSL